MREEPKTLKNTTVIKHLQEPIRKDGIGLKTNHIKHKQS